MTDSEKATARAAFHSQVYNEFQEFANLSKLERIANKTIDEAQGAFNTAKKAVNKAGELINDLAEKSDIPENPDGY